MTIGIRHLVMVGLVAASLMVGCATVPPSSPAAPVTERSAFPGVVIPLYVYPAEGSRPAWDQVAEAAQKFPDVPVIVVVNPNNGPGRAADANYRSVMRELSRSGVELVAYVALGYGQRPMRQVQADIRMWRRLYRPITGVFFDEVPIPGEDLSRREARDYISAAARYADSRGFGGTIIGNPGTAAPADYSAPDAFDLVVVHEDRWWPAPDALEGGPRPERSVVLVYGEGVWDPSRARRIIEDGRFLFVDDHSRDVTGTGNSPWTFFPDNLAEQLELLGEYGGAP